MAAKQDGRGPFATQSNEGLGLVRKAVVSPAPMAQGVYVEFVEFSQFARNITLLGDDEEYLALQIALMERPDAGAIIPGSGGLRKLRWAGSGRGKRGGLRLIYYYVTAEGQILLLHLYAKNEMEDLPPALLKKLKQEVEQHLS
jgi:hypothetical protein